MGEVVTVEKISKDQSWDEFDSAARRILDLSGDEVIRRWEAGDFTGQNSPELMRVLMLRPSGR